MKEGFKKKKFFVWFFIKLNQGTAFHLTENDTHGKAVKIKKCFALFVQTFSTITIEGSYDLEF